jgi:hypothetical protein
MATLVQHHRVVRRKLIDRIKGAGIVTVTGYEPDSAPDTSDRIHCAVVNGPGRAVPIGSPLNATSVWCSFIVYLYLRLPLGKDDQQSLVDPKVTDARDTILDQLHNPIGYGDAVELDPNGAYGDPIRWAPGYLDQGEGKYRAETITPGFVAFGVWDQIRS